MIYGNRYFNEGFLKDAIKHVKQSIDKFIGKKDTSNDNNKEKEIVYNNIGNYKVINAKSKQDLDKMYKKEMLTAEGITTNEATCKQVDEWFRKVNNCDPAELDFYICTGKDMNKIYNLTGKNRYTDNLHILAIDWIDVIDKGKSPYKGQWRWFSDIVDNNAKREIQAGNPAYNHYHSIYYGDIGIKD